MDEKRIEQVIEIESKAQEIHDAALSEAEQLVKQAEHETQAMLVQEVASAEEEARRMVQDARVDDEVKRILAQAEEEAARTEALAMTNFDRAVSYILSRVVGKA